MRFGCFGLIVGIALLWGGGQGTYVALANRSVTVVSIEEVMEQKPTAKWLSISGGQIDFLDSVVSERNGRTTDFYIPLVSEGASPGDPIHVIYHTKSQEFRSILNRLSKIIEDPELGETEKMIKLAMESNKISAARTFEGLVEFGVNKDSSDDKASAMFDNLAPGAIMLEADIGNARPHASRRSSFVRLHAAG